MWSAIGEIIFTVVVGYMGAIELLFVAKQLYHLAFQHQRRQMLLADDRGMRTLQERIDREITEAAQKEILGYNAMKDGILYKDGFRIDPGEINDHETRQCQASRDTKIERELNEHRTENIVKETTKATNESEVRQEVIEEPCVKMIAKRVAASQPEIAEAQVVEDKQTIPTQKVKTQIGQTNLEEYIHPSEVETSTKSQTDSTENMQSSPLRTEIHFQEYHREELEGQDVSEPQYSDDYLRSLDGIKKRPLIRDDGTRRRRAFKKRHSSDSTSSRESRASREEELKMFTSLEEEEFESIRRGDSQYAPITYSSDPNLLKTGKHQRRHKKSPIKDTKHVETEDNKSSLEMLDEENSSPWGDIKPEHYKDTEFWKREKAVSIEEESDENASSMKREDIQRHQAGQLIASPTPTKNIPQFSSFEEATHSQHQDAISTLNNQKPRDEAKKSSEIDVEKVSSPPSPSEAGLQGVLIEQEASVGTEETIACDESGEDALRNAGLRKSPRIDDIDRYEERLYEEDENTKVRAMLPSAQPRDNKLESPLLTEPQTNAARASSKSISPAPIRESMTNESLYKFSGIPQTPVIEVIRVGSATEETSKEPGALLEGISDFYDFNASINPSRSPSRERSLRKSISPIRSPNLSRKLMGKKDKTQIDFVTNDLSGLSGFYDFCVMMNQHAYGHCFQRAHSAHRSSTDYLEAKLNNRRSNSKSPSRLISAPKNGVASLPETGGGIPNSKNCPIPQHTPLTVDVLNVEDYKRSPSPLDIPFVSILQKRSDNTTTSPLDNPLTPVNLKHFNSRGDSFFTASTPLETPETPEFQRSFSANMRYLEQMKDEYRTNAFKRSTYVGESMDFENDFEELREQTRHFKRSRSRSRSPLLEDVMDPCTSKQAAQRELQDRILEEITKTTIHYQDFSRDISQRFIDQERRGSDSALLQKESIPIEDNLREKALQSDEELLNELEGEEYHHFRRFSLNLENQEDSNLEDTSYVFFEEINDQIGHWTRNDFYDKDNVKNLETEPVQGSTASLDVTGTDSDHAEADDIDTESEDDRQTVVEVDHEIDEDVFDYERPEEQSNEQSECEEAEREMDRYANRNASDWNYERGIDEFALPVDKSEDDSINIDQMYNDAVRNTEESGIEKDYDTIVEAMNEEERNSTQNKDEMSVSTEELLNEILQENEGRSSHKLERKDQIDTFNFINHEDSREVLNKSAMTSTITSSTRLRSRYGYGPAILHRNYDNLDNLNVDINYKPKKEYKWRKNFKLDDDSETAESLENQNSECKSSSDLNLVELDDGQENVQIKDIELSSQLEENKSFQISNNFEGLTEGNDEAPKDNGTSKGAVKKQNIVRNEILNNIDESIPEEEELMPSTSHEIEKMLRKKKTKRKSRRGSKTNFSNDEDSSEVLYPQIAENKEPDPECLAKIKPKRKKKILETISPPTPTKVSDTLVTDILKGTEIKNSSKVDLKAPSPPRPDALLNTTNFQPLSLSPAKTPPPALNSRTPNTQPLEKLPEASKTSVHLTATSDAGESKSKSNSSTSKPATSNGSSSTQPATSPQPQLERNDSSGVYELIKDGSMYPWF